MATRADLDAACKRLSESTGFYWFIGENTWGHRWSLSCYGITRWYDGRTERSSGFLTPATARSAAKLLAEIERRIAWRREAQK